MAVAEEITNQVASRFLLALFHKLLVYIDLRAISQDRVALLLFLARNMSHFISQSFHKSESVLFRHVGLSTVIIKPILVICWSRAWRSDNTLNMAALIKPLGEYWDQQSGQGQ